LEFWPDYGQEHNLEATDTGLETGILGLGHYQQEISDREIIILLYIENFVFWPDYGLAHRLDIYIKINSALRSFQKPSHVQIGS
jgi:hypothetical protein